MGCGYVMVSVSGKTKKDINQTGIIPSPMRMVFVEFIEALDEPFSERDDRPEDVTFDWVEPVAWIEGKPVEESVSAGDLRDLIDVIPSLKWLRKLAEVDDEDIKKAWEVIDFGEFSLKGFLVNTNLDKIIDFCDQARERGDSIVTLTTM